MLKWQPLASFCYYGEVFLNESLQPFMHTFLHTAAVWRENLWMAASGAKLPPSCCANRRMSKQFSFTETKCTSQPDPTSPTLGQVGNRLWIRKHAGRRKHRNRRRTRPARRPPPLRTSARPKPATRECCQMGGEGGQSPAAGRGLPPQRTGRRPSEAASPRPRIRHPVNSSRPARPGPQPPTISSPDRGLLILSPERRLRTRGLARSPGTGHMDTVILRHRGVLEIRNAGSCRKLLLNWTK